MSPAALADTHAIWQVALGLGAVVLLVVIVLMVLLLSYIRDIEQSVGTLIDATGEVAQNTSNIPKLTGVPDVLNQVVDEAVVQNEYMDVLADHFKVNA